MIKSIDIVELFEKSPRITIPLFVACATILFLPEMIYSGIGINPPQGYLRTVIGILFLVSFISFCSWAISIPVKHYFGRLRDRFLLKHQMRTLSDDELKVLREFFDKGMKSMHHSIGDGTALGLARKGILYQPSPFGRPGSISLNVDDKVWTYLQEHPEILEVAKNE